MTGSIAIVGMACIYPDAHSPEELWHNILAQRRAFRCIPAERLRLSDYYSPDRLAPDCTYSIQAAVIEGYEFDRVRFGVTGTASRSTDLVHWLALDVASQALADADFPNGNGLPRENTGVLVGNTLTGDISRANALRLRWPYVRRTVEAVLMEEGRSQTERQALLEKLEIRFKSPFPTPDEETLAGGLSNTIAGGICNHFDLKGGGFTIDGACASSLLAVSKACSSLSDGELDVALSGGVDLSLDPFELVGFAKAGVLASKDMRIYDSYSDGFWPGEGCGFVVLMRYEDAVAKARRIYALIRGWGLSSDGAGATTRPEKQGQLLALRRAYHRAGFGIDTVTYFEGHGTGTKVGDTTELQALSTARRESMQNASRAVIGSIKANIGHAKAAAGVAGLIKTALALHHQIIPPTTGCKEPCSELASSGALRVTQEALPWPVYTPLRAGVSAMGFGGINTHLAMEGVATERRGQLSSSEQSSSDSPQDAELFLMEGPSLEQLSEWIEPLIHLASKLSHAELTDLAAQLARKLKKDEVRAAVVASTPAELANGLATVQMWLQNGIQSQIDLEAGAFLGTSNNVPRIGFLFPGQGAPIHKGVAMHLRRFPLVQELYARSNSAINKDNVSSAVHVQPMVVMESLATLRVLNILGCTASVGIGHSLGELAALHWAGAFDDQALLRIALARGRAMTNLEGPGGAMLAVEAPLDDLTSLLEGQHVSIACYNSPRQTVVSGQINHVATLAALAQAKGLRTFRLKVSHAFHSPLIAGAEQALVEALSGEAFRPLGRKVISTVTGAILPPDEDLRALLVRQLVSPVRFTEALAAISQDVNLLMDVGPGTILSGLVRDNIKTPVVSVDAGGPSIKGLLNAVGAAFALGAQIDHYALFADRFTRRFDLPWRPRFIGNPCELAPALNGIAVRSEPQERKEILDVQPVNDTSSEANPLAPHSGDKAAGRSAAESLRRVLARRTELPPSAIFDESRMARDLRLPSIKVGQVVAETARQLGVLPPMELTDYANATFAEIARALEDLKETTESGSRRQDEEFPAGVDSWIRTFKIELVERPLLRHQQTTTGGDWVVLAPYDHPLKLSLSQQLNQLGKGGGVVVCLPAQADYPAVELLLEGARCTLSRRNSCQFVLVQHRLGAAGFARTLHLEMPEVTTSVIDVPFDNPQSVEWVTAEIRAAEGYTEAHYDSFGTRREPRLCLMPLIDFRDEMPLENTDVLLVTGGGKGIAAECALDLGRRTGVRLALLGRSLPEEDHELAENLDRIRAAGIQCAYFVADVTNNEAVRIAVRSAKEKLGNITAVLHSAGTNTPHALTSLNEIHFRQTLAPKLEGIRNVLAAIDRDDLRLLVTFSSIIARTGLPGEADYAVANEWLSALTEQFQEERPHCRCLALEWSIWSGVGMGQRLGRVDALMHQGITPISPEDGVRMLWSLLAQPLPSVSVIATGRFGPPPTLKFEHPDIPSWRFLEKPRVHYPGVELVVDSALSVTKDPYLDDHVFQGDRLFPAVLGLEAIAQAAMALAGSSVPPTFEDVQFSRPIVVPETGSLIIRVGALSRKHNRIEVTVRSSETAFRVDCFHAMCRFDVEPDCMETRQHVVDIDFQAGASSMESERIQVNPKTDLYGGILFHRGRFQRLSGYRRLWSKECVAEISPDGPTVWFGNNLPNTFVLGDPAARDAALHSIQACIPQARIFPVGLDRGEVNNLSKSASLLAWAAEISHDRDNFVYNVVITDLSGNELERWFGLRLHIVEPLPEFTIWPVALLGPYLERRLEELLSVPGMTVAVEYNSSVELRKSSDALIRRILRTTNPVLRRPDGKPEVADERSVSIAHAGDLFLAVAACGFVGCDIETVTARSRHSWNDLLGATGATLADIILRESRKDIGHFDIAATRVWVARECLKKAGIRTEVPLTLSFVEARWVGLSAGSLTIATFVAVLPSDEGLVVFGILRDCKESPLYHEKTRRRAKPYEDEWIVTVGDTNEFGSVYFAKYFDRQGCCRDKFLETEAHGAIDELQDAGLALVTASCSCEYYSEIFRSDKIHIRMYLEVLKATSLALRFDYVRDSDIVARGEQVIAVIAHKPEHRNLFFPKSLLRAMQRYSTGQEPHETLVA